MRTVPRQLEDSLSLCTAVYLTAAQRCVANSYGMFSPSVHHIAKQRGDSEGDRQEDRLKSDLKKRAARFQGENGLPSLVSSRTGVLTRALLRVAAKFPGIYDRLSGGSEG